MTQLPATNCRILFYSDNFNVVNSARQLANAQLLGRIRESFAASDRTYGSPRIVRDLQQDGSGCSVNRVARLMQAAGIQARHKRRRQAWSAIVGRAFSRPQSARPTVRSDWPKPEVGCRLHLRLDC